MCNPMLDESVLVETKQELVTDLAAILEIYYSQHANAIVNQVKRIIGLHDPCNVDNAMLQLALLCYLAGVRPAGITTICEIIDYCYTYAISADLQALTGAMYRAEAARINLVMATSSTASIHSWQGNMAHQLLHAAQMFTVAANAVIRSDDGKDTQLKYAAEKVQTGLSSLYNAFMHLPDDTHSRWFENLLEFMSQKEA